MPISKEKFTAGPWIKDGSTVIDRKGFAIVVLPEHGTGPITPEQQEANLQIISASTDMYNFIKDLYESAQRNQAHYPELEKVYNKALGINP